MHRSSGALLFGRGGGSGNNGVMVSEERVDDSGSIGAAQTARCERCVVYMLMYGVLKTISGDEQGGSS